MKTSPQHGFEFVSDLTGFRAPGWRIVRIGGPLRRKAELLRALADGLEFPSYFGHNWDALDECLRDLSWLGPESAVVLVHERLPLADHEQRRTYLDLLRNAQRTGQARLRIIFPASAQAVLEA